MIFKYFQQIKKKSPVLAKWNTLHTGCGPWAAYPVSGLFGLHPMSNVLLLVLNPHLSVSEIILLYSFSNN